MGVAQRWTRHLDIAPPKTSALEEELERAREELATIRRICTAAGIPTTNLNAVACVKLLARESDARAAMNRVLIRQQDAARSVASHADQATPAAPLSFRAAQRRLHSLQLLNARLATDAEQGAYARAEGGITR
jgi:hypothetical protein